MKKTITALAVLGAFMANASAQSNVTIYGIVDAGVTHVNNNGTGPDITSVEAGQLQTSRWGFRGVEDIGNGIKARFDLEGTLFNDTGTAGVGTGAPVPGTITSSATSLFDRQATVGLSGNFGSIDIGRQNILGVNSVGMAEPMGLSFAGTSPNVLFSAMNNGFVYGTYGANYSGSALRQGNSVKYVTPVWNGLGFAVMRAMGERPDNIQANSYTGVAAFYTAGPFGAAGAYARMKNATNDLLKSYAVGLKYTMPAAVLKATYSANELESTNRKIAVAGVGVDVPMSPAITLTAAVYDTRRDGDGIENDSQQYIAIAKYAFSKRSIGYVSIGHAQTDSVVGAQVSPNGFINLAPGFVAAGSDKANRFTAGVMHAF
jgi:predicted porin